MKVRINIDFENGYNGVKTRINKPINSNEDTINKILYFITSGITTLTTNCKKYQKHSVQYNNAAFITLH